MPPIRHIVYECLPGAYAGGVQKMVFELASAQRRLGADVEIWTVNATRAGSTEHFEGLPIRYFYPDRAFGLAKSKRMEQAFADLPRDSVLHSHCTYHPLNLQVGRAARRHGHRAFYHPHGALSPLWLKGWNFQAFKKRAYIALFKKRNLSDASGVFALTEAERKDLLSLGIGAPLSVLSNGIVPVAQASPDAGQEFRRRFGIPPNAPSILFIGRVVPLKKLEDIIGVLAELRDTHPDLHLIIAGEVRPRAAYASWLKERALAMGVAERVRWTGFLDEKEKPAAYAAAQAFIHASDSEGMSISILEAMSAALPVVVTRGCHMSAAAEAGALLECAQGAGPLAQAVARCLAAAPGIVDRALEYVKRCHSWDSLARQAIARYEEAKRIV